jgi:hypothetical protein
MRRQKCRTDVTKTLKVWRIEEPPPAVRTRIPPDEGGRSARRFGEDALPIQPPNFDCRDPMDVLRLRLRDWWWPTAAVIAMAIPFLGRSSGLTYQIGSLAYYANTYGLLVFLPAIFLAGLRWCWVGRLRPRDPNRCGHCNYRLDWMNAEPGPRHCPECGAAASGSTGRRRVPIARLLLDLPGILAMLFPIGLAVMLMLAMLGLLDLD